jgi:hypothetical protein
VGAAWYRTDGDFGLVFGIWYGLQGYLGNAQDTGCIR